MQDLMELTDEFFTACICGAFIVPWIIVASFFVYAFAQASERKRIQQDILKAKGALHGQAHRFPVRYATGAKFKKWFKIFPWEGAGMLFVGSDQAAFYGRLFSGRELECTFHRGDSQVRWLGKSEFFKQGASSWCVVEHLGGRHYFSSETGAFVFGSDTTTHEVYDALSEMLGPTG